MPACELILYATPTGRSAADANAFFRAADAVGGTTAQAYPPHCSLTGFFRRTQQRRADAVAALAEVLRADGLGPNGLLAPLDVQTSDVVHHDGWVGHTIAAPRLGELAARFAVLHGHDDTRGEDAVRLKTGLHLSLAYDDPPIGRDLEPYVALARRRLRSCLADPWEVALWERYPDGSWKRLGPPAGSLATHGQSGWTMKNP